MGHVPLVGRLNMWEYLALTLSFVLIGLESLIRIITLALPAPVIKFFYYTSRNLFNLFSTPQSRKSRNRKKAIVTSIAQASDFVEICNLFGYYAEEHVVQTGDGYLLGLHRLGWRKDEANYPVMRGTRGPQKKVIYMHHGLLMNSEVWVCLTEKEKCLPFLLVERGYDVWLGNNRGNKYSKKSIHCAPTESRFWNFSIDQFAFHDVPDSINYILSTTRQKSLSYIGFSQGTAQAFASLSINPGLNEKVNMFIALAPAMSPSGLSYGIVDTFIKTSPEILFLAFGRRSILSAATMWQAILYPPIFIRFIDLSISFLFGWRTRNIPMHQKLAAYPHLYSFTSTKSVVHWFQIMRNGVFQMYDDEVNGPLNLARGAKYYKVVKFPTRNIKTPIVLVYGGSDSLVDINVMLKELPRHTRVVGVPHYEHLDFLWATDVDRCVFPHVLDALASVSQRIMKNESTNYRDHPVGSVSGKHTALESEYESRDYITDAEFNADVDADADADIDSPIKIRSSQASENYPADGQMRNSQIPLPRNERVYSANQYSGQRFSSTPPSVLQAQFRAKPRFSSSAAHNTVSSQEKAHSPSLSASFATERSSNSRPEGWWSSDELVGTESSVPSKSSSFDKEKVKEIFIVGSNSKTADTDATATTTATTTATVTGSVPSTQWMQSESGNKSAGTIGGTNIRASGISIGASKAVGGLSNRDAMGMNSPPGKTSSLDGRGRKKAGKKKA